jgi:protein-S-isoprenylcysteine O-methyltransferase Ste14
MAMWAAFALCTRPWRVALVYHANWSWIAGLVLFTTGLSIHSQALKHFSAKQLGGVPELHRANRDQRLITTGIRSRVRHPVYLAYLCEMLGLSIGTGLAVCWALTAFAIATGAAMIGAEDTELEKRFGEEYRAYRSAVPAVFPRMSASRQL